MLKHVVFFFAGAFTILVAAIAYGLISAHRASNAIAVSSGPVTAVITIRVAQDPKALLPVKDVSALLDRIAGLTDSEKKKIRAALASNLATEVRIESDVGGESRWITVHPNAPNLSVQGSMKARFGPAELQLEKVEKKPNQPPQRNAGSRPSSSGSPLFEALSSLGPRG